MRVLVDAGISHRRLGTALESFGESLDGIDAVLLTHEHNDHVSAVPMLRRHQPNIRMYSTRGTGQACVRNYRWKFSAVPVASGRAFPLGDARVTPFRVRHDAAEPVGYRFDWPGFSMALATDLGTWDGLTRQALRDCQLVLVESNYDPDLLRAGPYPAYLKRRVSSPLGHLANAQTRHLLAAVAGPRLESVVLTHMSAENNEAELAVKTVAGGLEGQGVAVAMAPRHDPGPAFEFEPRPDAQISAPTIAAKPVQTTLAL